MRVGIHEAIHEAGVRPNAMNRGAQAGAALCGAIDSLCDSGSHRLIFQSQESAPPDWYSMTRVSKKLRSFFRSIISLIQGKGFSSLGNSGSKPICVARRLAM